MPGKRKRSETKGAVLLELNGVSRDGLFEGINLRVHGGEVVGLAGLVGAGRSELARCIYGLYRPDQGRIRFQGKEWKPGGPEESCRRRLAYVPEERKRQGFVLGHSAREGISIGFLRAVSRLGLISGRKERERVGEAVRRFGIRARTVEQPIGTLSGGNQQKALLARWLEEDPQLIILDEPARGVDVGAKVEIHRLINELAQRGKGVLLISSDLPEILALSDRVVVLHEGRLAGEFTGNEITQENLILAASGFQRGLE